ncbi:CHAT domain-containing protein [Halostreptopolyspora alba]|uniref:CHAT domain-containing protein n=1 Tax=Halostreptopolyspora alba TaxID=2487137 RepID=A0A3N0E3M3_9ACTN|nr:CHAT domain-containing protein [Nocardiopsaceae bacterium YIM 96095]
MEERVHHAERTGDPSPLLSSAARADADTLTKELLLGRLNRLDQEAFTRAAHALGSLRWQRHQALVGGDSGDDLEGAVVAFAACLIRGRTDVPASLLPRIAEQATPAVVEAFQSALEVPDPDTLAYVAQLWERVVDATPNGHPDRPVMLSSRGVTLHHRFDLTGDPEDLDGAVTALREAATTIPPDHSERSNVLRNLGNVLEDLYLRTGHGEHLDEVIGACRAFAAVSPVEDPALPLILSNLAAWLRSRFRHTNDGADLNEAVDAAQRAVDLSAPDDPNQAMFRLNLGSTLGVRYQYAGNREDVERAVSILEEAADADPPNHSTRQEILSGLDLAKRLRDLGPELEPEVATALSEEGEDDPTATLMSLGLARYSRFHNTGHVPDLDTAIAVFREVERADSTGQQEQGLVPGLLAEALRERFEQGGDHGDLDEATRVGQRALELGTTSTSLRPVLLSAVGLAFRDRSGLTGDLAALDTAIGHLREAERTTPDNSPNRAMHLSNLAGALRERHQWTGDGTDLDSAIALLRESVDITDDGDPEQVRFLANLANALHTRYHVTGDPTDLSTAIDVAQHAADKAPDGRPDRPIFLSNLGAMLCERHGITGDPSDLDAAVRFGRKASDTAPEGALNRAMYHSQLATTLRVRHGLTGEVSDLDTAISHLREAERTTPDDDPNRTKYMLNLGYALEQRFALSDCPHDRDSATAAYTAAWETSSGPPSTRIAAAREAARLLRATAPGRSCDLLEDAVRLLPTIAPRWLRRDDQQRTIGACFGLADEAAAAALNDHRSGERQRAARALQALETGRAVLMSQRLDTRGDVSDLAAHHPELARRFVELRDRLDSPESEPAMPEPESPASALARHERVTTERRRLAAELDALLERIRDLDGYASFAGTPPMEELQAEARPGPIVVFTCEDERGHALLLTEDGVGHLDLPGLRRDTVITHVDLFQEAVEITMSGEDRSRRSEAEATMNRILRWLWDEATGPVLEALGHRSTPSDGETWPRVWWVPGALLGFLPIHAAGHHTDPKEDPGRRTVMDRVVSSHTPTVRALRRSRARTPEHSATRRALIVAMPTTPGPSGGAPEFDALPFVDTEVERVSRQVPDSVLLREPTHGEGDTTADVSHLPTRSNVLAHLPEADIAHFACHGKTDPGDPSQGLLVLRDYATTPLTVASLDTVHLDRVRLAYLSACRTSGPELSPLMDEAVTLASAFQIAGFPHVISTLWEVNDEFAGRVAGSFYSRLRTDDGELDPGRAAHALHHTIRDLRDFRDLGGVVATDAIPTGTRAPSLWAGYMHTGC